MLVTAIHQKKREIKKSEKIRPHNLSIQFNQSPGIQPDNF